jgi:hypothetical protein
MDSSSAKLLNSSAARIEAIRITLRVMIVTLVRTGALPAEQFAAHLRQEAEKLPLLDSLDNDLLAIAQQARDQEIGAYISLANQAGDSPPLAIRPPHGAGE